MGPKYKQTRKSVSISGDLYQEMQKVVQTTGRSMSDLVESQMRKFLQMPARPAKAEPKAAKKHNAPHPWTKKTIEPAEPKPAPEPVLVKKEEAKAAPTVARTPDQSFRDWENRAVKKDSNGIIKRPNTHAFTF